MAGVFALTSEGELHLALTRSCTVGRDTFGIECSRGVLDSIPAIAHTPWNRDIRGTWRNASHIVFQIDWKSSGLDPLANDASTIVARPWEVSGTKWVPTAAEAAMILNKVSDATDTETVVVRGGAPPALEVTTFEVEGDAFHAGESSTLVVRIANRGAGAAYRVVATTHSSIEALHNRRLSFGSIKPGADKVRKLTLSVPAAATTHDTMIVLAISEGNGVAPRNVNRRVPIAPSTAAPLLHVRCTVGGRIVERLDLDAGEHLTFRCTIDNTGNADAKLVELAASVANEPPTPSRPQAIAASGHETYNVPIDIPRSLPINSEVPIAITVRDRQSSRGASTTVVGVIRKPSLCKPGMTRADYDVTLKEFQLQRTARRITEAEYDDYEAQLVGCLK